MNNENDIQALTDQPVTIVLGGKQYSIRRCTMYDVGVVNKFTKEKQRAGDVDNIELDSMFFLLCHLMKEFHPDLTPEKLARLVPVNEQDRIEDALETVGFLGKDRKRAKP